MTPPPDVPGYPGRRLPAQTFPDERPTDRMMRHVKTLDEKVGGMELRLVAIESDTRDIKFAVTTFKAALNQALSKGLVLVLGAIGGTWGLNKVTEPKPEPSQTVIQRSAFDRALDACRTRPDEEQVSCFAKVYAESRSPQR